MANQFPTEALNTALATKGTDQVKFAHSVKTLLDHTLTENDKAIPPWLIPVLEQILAEILKHLNVKS